MMKQPKLFLFDFFTQLREKVGLELDTVQYYLFLKTFLHGYGRKDRESLRRLCKALWLTHPKWEKDFDWYFDRALDSYRLSVRRRPPKEEPVSVEPAPAPDLEEKPKTKETTVEPSAPPAPGDSAVSRPEIPKRTFTEVFLEFSDRPPEGREGEPATGPAEEPAALDLLDHPFIFSGRYLPVRKRLLQQTWRYLRYHAEKEDSEEVDMAATVEKISREGFFSELVYDQQIVYRQSFQFLIDHGGSMVAFERLSDRIVEAFRESIQEEDIQTWYFRNVPGSYLFTDRFHRQRITMQQWLKGLARKPAYLFIISDAGAARGNMNEARLRETLTFIERVRWKSPHLLWLNPLPRRRWAGSAAPYIASAVAMEEFSQAGINRLPDILKHF